MKKIFVIILLFSIFLSAQDNKVKIGFGLNSYILEVLSDGNNNVTMGVGLPIPPLNYSLNFKYIINKKFSFQSKLGYAIPILEYSGLEYGISGEYNFKKNYYASIGLMKHNNVEGGDYGVEADINFINAGFGYKVSRYLSIEAIYFYPLNKEIIGDDNTYHHVLQPKPMAEAIRRIESMIYLSFVFGWEL